MNKDAKYITELGLSMMTEEARRERIEAVYADDHTDALAELIDECKMSIGLLFDGAAEGLDKERVQEMLLSIDGKKAVADMSETEIADWIGKLEKGR